MTAASVARNTVASAKRKIAPMTQREHHEKERVLHNAGVLPDERHQR